MDRTEVVKLGKRLQNPAGLSRDEAGKMFGAYIDVVIAFHLKRLESKARRQFSGRGKK